MIINRSFLNKKTLTIGFLLVGLLSLPLILLLVQKVQDIRQRASIQNSATLSGPAQATINSTTDIAVKVVTDSTTKVTGVDVSFAYDPSSITIESFQPNLSITKVYEKVNNSIGKFQFIGYAKTPITGSADLGVLKVKAIKAGATSISFSDLKVSSVGSGNTNVQFIPSNASITITTNATPTPSSVCPSDGGNGSVNQCRSTSCLPGSTEVNGVGGNNDACKQLLGTSQGFCCNISAANQGLCPGGTSGNTCRATCLSNESSVTNAGAVCAFADKVISGNYSCCKKAATPTSSPTPTIAPPAVCVFTPSNVLTFLQGNSRSFSLNASSLPVGTIDIGYTSGTDKLFKNFNNTIPFNSTMFLSTTNSTYTNGFAGGSHVFNFNITTTSATPTGQYTLDAIYLLINGTKTQCTYAGLGGLVINVTSL